MENALSERGVLLSWMARMAAGRNLQVFTRVYETRSQAVLARIGYEADARSLVSFLDRLGFLNKRLTIAHGVWISDAEIELLGAADANLACNPISNLKLLNGVAPIRCYADAGVNIALGCDNCSGSDAQNIIEAMKSFALLWGMQGEAGESGAARRAFQAATRRQGARTRERDWLNKARTEGRSCFDKAR